MAQFETTLTLSASRDHVFNFLIRPANILNLAPPDAKLKFLEAPVVLEFGSRFEFQMTSVGPAQILQHEITHFDTPCSFTETQIKGPLSAYRHEHIFESDHDGHVRLIDRIEFEPPGGLAGFLVTEQFIRNSLESAFEHRHQELKRLIELA